MNIRQVEFRLLGESLPHGERRRERGFQQAE